MYDEYVTGYIDVAAQFGCHVVAPEDEWRYRNNSPYCKDDFKRRTAPCLLIIPECVANEDEVHADSYLHHAGNENVVKFYFGDTLQHITNCKYFTVLYTWRKEGQT